jgi:hypothetical protein
MDGDARIESLAKRLGNEAAARLDVDATARKVVERLREPPARPALWIHQTWLRIAAALVIVVGGAVVVSRLSPGGHPGLGAHTAHFVADDLRDLSSEELRDVLTAFDEMVGSNSGAVPEGSTDLRELDAHQLRAVLRSLEG